MGATEDARGMHPVPIQPNDPNQVLPERLGKGKSPQSPQVGRAWERYSHARATAVWHLNSLPGETQLLHTSNSQDTRQSEERTSLQDTFQMSSDELHTQPHSVCLAPGQLGVTTRCRRGATAALPNKIAI